MANGVVHVQHLLFVFYESILARLIIVVGIIIKLLLPVFGLLDFLNAGKQSLTLHVLLTQAFVQLHNLIILLIIYFIFFNQLSFQGVHLFLQSFAIHAQLLFLVLGDLGLLLHDLDIRQLLLEVNLILLDNIGQLLYSLVVILALLVVYAFTHFISGPQLECLIPINLALLQLFSQVEHLIADLLDVILLHAVDVDYLKQIQVHRLSVFGLGAFVSLVKDGLHAFDCDFKLAIGRQLLEASIATVFGKLVSLSEFIIGDLLEAIVQAHDAECV